MDLHVKKKFFTETIYCIDEIETHLHTRVQGRLLKELVKIVPGHSQLWVTTHSLGVIRAAQELATDIPGSVCVIDFDGVDSDVPQQLVPSNLGRVSWGKLLSIALDDLSQRIAPITVVVCEGSSTGKRRKDFDAEIYNRVLGQHHPDVLFVSDGGSNELEQSGVSYREILSRIVPTAKVWALSDRDDKSETEVAERRTKSALTLPMRNLESYLFADDVIEALVTQQMKQTLLTGALDIKKAALANAAGRGNPSDDLKSAAGEIYTNLKSLLGLQRCGNNTEAFMRDTLAPLIVPSMSTYQALKAAIIDAMN